MLFIKCKTQEVLFLMSSLCEKKKSFSKAILFSQKGKQLLWYAETYPQLPPHPTTIREVLQLLGLQWGEILPNPLGLNS